MSKARKNTTKAPKGNAAAVKELRANLALLIAKEAAAADALAAYTAADVAFNKIARPTPPVPVHERKCTPEAEAAFQALTIAEARDMPEGNAYTAWYREQAAAYAAEMTAYKAAMAALKNKCGNVAAEKRWEAAAAEVSRLAQKIIRAKAHGVEAIAIKLRAIHIAEFDGHQLNWLGGFVQTIEATATAAGFNTRAKPVAK